MPALVIYWLSVFLLPFYLHFFFCLCKTTRDILRTIWWEPEAEWVLNDLGLLVGHAIVTGAVIILSAAVFGILDLTV